MLRIRSGSGLGDAIYLQAIVRHLLRCGQSLEICTNFPEVFSQLPVKTAEFSRQNIDVIAHYTRHKFESSTQFDDCCTLAGLKGVEYKLDWKVQKDFDLPDNSLLVFAPREPWGRQDGYGMELLPDLDVFEDILSRLDYFKVLIGKDRPLRDIKCDLDLVGKTSVTDLIDLGVQCNAMYGQISHMVPLAESLDKKCLILFSKKGLECTDQRISSITPRKICHKNTSYHLIDDYSLPMTTLNEDFRIKGSP